MPFLDAKTAVVIALMILPAPGRCELSMRWVAWHSRAGWPLGRDRHAL